MYRIGIGPELNRKEDSVNADIFADWFRRQGRHVYRTPSSYWYDAGMRVVQAFPFHWIIEPAEKELNRLLLENNAIALRYSAPIGAAQVMPSYHVICEDPGYCLSCLNRKARQNVRRGLDYAGIEHIPISRLATEGWKLRLDTLIRQGRVGAETEEWWRRVCMSARDLPGFEAWGAIRDGQLIASFLAFKCDDYYLLPYEQSATAHLQSRANNALYFFVMQEIIKREGVSKIFLGLQSLDAPISVDDFKFRMGCTAKVVGQRVVFHPLLRSFANGLTHKLVIRLLRRYRNNHVLTKAEGLLRFYLQGKWPSYERQRP